MEPTPSPTPPQQQENTTEMSRLDVFLESEKEKNRNDSWNKLDNGLKLQKLHSYAEQYAKDHKLPIKEIRVLKAFFTECLTKNKLQKTKEVAYDKNAGTIQNIPSLFFNLTNKNFTLRNIDNKRVSTLKSLTPKKAPPATAVEPPPFSAEI
jgi:hypothetical protein